MRLQYKICILIHKILEYTWDKGEFTEKLLQKNLNKLTEDEFVMFGCETGYDVESIGDFSC